MADVAVVTGAGSGLGQALAVELANRGLTVVGFGRRNAALRETADLIGSGRFIPRSVDVADAAAVAAAFAHLDRQRQRVTILINNAAVYDRFDFLEADPELFMQSVRINLGGAVNCCNAALGRMAETGTGRILNVASFADLRPIPGSSAYSVSKGAARIFTQALVAELADRFPGIVVTDWAPGVLATRMGRPDGIAPKVAARWGAELALADDPALNGAVFVQDIEQLPPYPLRWRLADLLLLRRRPPPRRLRAADPDAGAG